jgi:hypothetical protein
MRSLSGWLYGSAYATHAESAAYACDTDGVKKTFKQIYATAPPPIAALPGDYADVDINRLLRDQGSPVMVFGDPIINPGMESVGRWFEHQVWTIHLTMFFGVFLDAATGEMNRQTTLRQSLSCDREDAPVLELLGRALSIYDFSKTPPQDTEIGGGQIFNVTSLPRSDQFRTDFTFSIRVPRDIEA